MIIDDRLIQYIQQLSRLRLTEAETEHAKKDLSDILSYMDKLNELDTENIEPLSHPFTTSNRFREDRVSSHNDRSSILTNAPAKTEEYFKAPKTVIE